MLEPRGKYDALCIDAFAFVRCCYEMTALSWMAQPLYINLTRLNVLLLLKPIDVSEIKIERQGLDLARGFSLLMGVRLNRMHIQRIKVPVTRRPQKHPLRHIPPPKLHRPANNDVLNHIVRRLRRQRQSKRSRTHD